MGRINSKIYSKKPLITRTGYNLYEFSLQEKKIYLQDHFTII